MNRALDEYISTLADTGSQVLSKSLRLWKSGIEYEQNFWNNWFETKGLEWPGDFEERQYDREVPIWLASHIPPGVDELRILDVGSGPLSKIGNKHPDRLIRVQAVDPLAHFYNDLVRNHLSRPAPIPVIFSFAEDLSCRFEAETFDMITCTNALDHAVAPMWSMLEMSLILKKGGRIFLSHRKNEAVFENYEGFHQWNFDRDEVSDNLIFWNKENRIDVNAVLGEYCTVSHVSSCESEYITTVIDKFAYPPFDPARYHRTLRACLLEAMLKID